MITDHAEGTFASLRYFLGGDHPSQTTHHTMSPDFKAGLESKYKKGGISRTTPPRASDAASKSPTYPTHLIFKPNVKL